MYADKEANKMDVTDLTHGTAKEPKKKVEPTWADVVKGRVGRSDQPTSKGFRLTSLKQIFFGSSKRKNWTFAGIAIFALVAFILLLAASQGSTVTVANPQTQDDGSDGLSPADTSGGGDTSASADGETNMSDGFLNQPEEVDVRYFLTVDPNAVPEGTALIIYTVGTVTFNGPGLPKAPDGVLKVTTGCGSCIPAGVYDIVAVAYDDSDNEIGRSTIEDYNWKQLP